MIESEYNRDQLTTLQAVHSSLNQLGESERDRVQESIQPYLRFREAVDRFFFEHFLGECRKACFETGISGCCGFESIITFASDHAINVLCSEPARIAALVDVLTRPNRTGKCVYLGPNGCLWSVRPISCAMFLCGRVKSLVLDGARDCEDEWSRLQNEEKAFTFPDRPVLFDSLEARLIESGVESPHLFFHRSPGLLLVKEKAGLWKRPASLKRRHP
ncbi:MAG: hypothetical protein AB9873_20900 [Syntrophobacteraceae bacterium]